MIEKKEIKNIVEVLKEMEEDNSIPKNIKDKLNITIDALKNDNNLKMSINKALHELDEIADDPNLQSYTRTQIWNVVSLLESVA